MTVEQYLGELEEQLQYLNGKDRLDVVKHYRDKINISLDYGESVQKVLATLPTPEKVAEDIYKSKGINYLEKRKKKKRKDQVLFSIVSSFIILICLAGFITIAFFDVFYIIKLVKLTIKSIDFLDFFDKLSLSLFNLLYSLMLIIGLIYVFDLFYIIINHFLEIILETIRKGIFEYKFMDFTISGWIEQKIKKRRFLLITLISCFGAFCLFGVSNYISKGYIYRSMNNITDSSYVFDLDGDVKKIKILENNGFIKFKSTDDSKIKINYSSEFIDDLKYNIEDNTLVVTPNSSMKFDILGILDEPIKTIEIFIPKIMVIEEFVSNVDEGIYDFYDLDQPQLVIDLAGNNQTVAITKCNIKQIKAKGSSISVALENNQVSSCNIDMNDGKFCSVNNTFVDLDVVNYLGDIIIQKTSFDNAKINNESGKAAIDKLDTNNLTYVATRSENHFQDVVLNNLDLSVFYNGNVLLERFIVKNNMNINEDGGYLKVDHAKCKTIKITGEDTVNNIYNLGQNLLEVDVEKSNELKDYFLKFNSHPNYSTSLDVNLKKGRLSLIKNSLSKLECQISDASLEITTLDSLVSNITSNNTQMNLNDVSGNTISIDSKKGSLVFYNDNTSSDIILYLKSDATMLDIDDSIKTN